jgi:Na+-translocating ferredoxin:NAD+ oxidoreductase RnfD subunit
LTLWTVLGQTTYYFNRDLLQLGVAAGSACLLDLALTAFATRQVAVPLSAYITALSVGILLESYDWRVFVVAPLWGILSKHLLRDRTRHFFNPSNFAIVMALLLSHGSASVAPGSQWGADYRIAFVIIGLGLMMMRRVKRLDLTLAWMGGFVLMGLVRMALGQGGLVFALGPVTGAEFALFTFSMLPDPKTSPPTRNGRLAWGLSIAVTDGVLRYLEIRYSMFYALFAHCAILPIIRAVAARRGVQEAEIWRTVEREIRSPARPREVAELAPAGNREGPDPSSG